MEVLLSFWLAEIYGYSTTSFNQQVKNNTEKFKGDDFSFYLFRILISKNLTSSWGGRRKSPRAFTESGIYMLMTFLRGNLTIAQSYALTYIFREKKALCSPKETKFTKSIISIRIGNITLQGLSAPLTCGFEHSAEFYLVIELDCSCFLLFCSTIEMSSVSVIPKHFAISSRTTKDGSLRPLSISDI